MSTPAQPTIPEMLIMSVDPSARKHKGNTQSVAAHEKVLPTKQAMYKKIMGLLTARGEFGATSKELAAAFGVQLHCLSGRCSELKSLGWIKESGSKRDSAAVLVLAEKK